TCVCPGAGVVIVAEPPTTSPPCGLASAAALSATTLTDAHSAARKPRPRPSRICPSLVTSLAPHSRHVSNPPQFRRRTATPATLSRTRPPAGSGTRPRQTQRNSDPREPACRAPPPPPSRHAPRWAAQCPP